MDIFGTHLTASTQETQALGEELAHNLTVNVICLYGELGSGKTTFSQGFARRLGFLQRLLSPTFILMRSYDLPDSLKLLHLDLYRLSGEQEIFDLGFTEAAQDSKNILLIEWAEKLGKLLPGKRIDIHFRTFADERHEVKIEKYG